VTTNVDQAEINKFDKLAEKWWDAQGECKPLHDINPLRLKFIQQHSILKQHTVLDVGCGGGILSESLAEDGANVTAIDASDKAIAVADAHAKQNHLDINYQRTTIEDFAQKNTTQFDVITCMELLEHVPNPGSIIATCADLLKPGGIVFFSTINRTLKAYLFAIIGAEYVLNLLPRGTHDYTKFIRPAELEEIAKQSDLKLASMTGMTYNPLTQSYRLTKNVDVNYLIHFTK